MIVMQSPTFPLDDLERCRRGWSQCQTFIGLFFNTTTPHGWNDRRDLSLVLDDEDILNGC